MYCKIVNFGNNCLESYIQGDFSPTGSISNFYIVNVSKLNSNFFNYVFMFQIIFFVLELSAKDGLA